MLTTTKTVEDLRLLEAADIAERNSEYNQRTFKNDHGTPGCMLGGYAAAHPEDFSFILGCPRLRNGKTAKDHENYFGLQSDEWAELFDYVGCGNAGRDGKKAAAYVRAFVERRALARIAAETSK